MALEFGLERLLKNLNGKMSDRLATDVSKYGTVRKDMGGLWVMTEWLWKMKLERAAVKYLDFIS